MSLLVDLSRLRSGVEQVDCRFDPSALGAPDEDFRVIAPIAFAATIRKDAQKVRVAGRLSTRLECACSRCLEPFEIPVDTEFDVLFLKAPGEAVGGEQEIADDDLGVSFYKDDVIDLGEVMREQFYLALPMKPLCQEHCQGLCPVCGVNRNRESCSCRAEWVDPRLEGLRRFKS